MENEIAKQHKKNTSEHWKRIPWLWTDNGTNICRPFADRTGLCHVDNVFSKSAQQQDCLFQVFAWLFHVFPFSSFGCLGSRQASQSGESGMHGLELAGRLQVAGKWKKLKKWKKPSENWKNTPWLWTDNGNKLCRPFANRTGLCQVNNVFSRSAQQQDCLFPLFAWLLQVCPDF